LKCWGLPGGRLLAVVKGDITALRVDAVVNPANSLMIMGGGVAGAIKRAGGEEIEREAMSKAPVPVGEAIVTTAGRLPAKAVIHAPTMERPAMRIPLENAVKATRAALKVAAEEGFQSIALPAMGAGVGGLSVRDVSREMARIAREAEGGPRLIVLVARGDQAYSEMLMGVEEALGSKGGECPEELRRLV
jgi:O-acetyl-ADP-ribose deacetylase (regulator of RNase III)